MLSTRIVIQVSFLVVSAPILPVPFGAALSPSCGLDSLENKKELLVKARAFAKSPLINITMLAILGLVKVFQ